MVLMTSTLHHRSLSPLVPSWPIMSSPCNLIGLAILSSHVTPPPVYLSVVTKNRSETHCRDITKFGVPGYMGMLSSTPLNPFVVCVLGYIPKNGHPAILPLHSSPPYFIMSSWWLGWSPSYECVFIRVFIFVFIFGCLTCEPSSNF